MVDKDPRDEQTKQADGAFKGTEFNSALFTEFGDANPDQSVSRGLLAPQIDELVKQIIDLKASLEMSFGSDFDQEVIEKQISIYLVKLLGRVNGSLRRFLATQATTPDQKQLEDANEIFLEHQVSLFRMVKALEAKPSRFLILDVENSFEALARSLREITELLTRLKPEKDLREAETTIENLLLKSNAAGIAIDNAIVAHVDPQASYILNFNQQIGGTPQATNQTYPTLYHLLAEMEAIDQHEVVMALGSFAESQPKFPARNIVVENWKKLSPRIETARTTLTSKAENVFKADKLTVDLEAVITTLTAAGVLHDGSQDHATDVQNLSDAIDAIKLGTFLGTAANLRDAKLAQAEQLLKQFGLSEWLKLLGTNQPDLKNLLIAIEQYPTSPPWSVWLHDQEDYLRGLMKAATNRPGLTDEQEALVKKKIDDPADKLFADIQSQLNVQSGMQSNPEYQRNEKFKELMDPSLSDWDLVDQSLTGAAKPHIEDHGNIDLTKPIEKAFYDALKKRIFTTPAEKRKEPGYTAADADGNAKFDMWLLARARMNFGAFTRKFVDSKAARSNVGLWKTEPPENGSELVMFAFGMYRGELMLETYHHPVVGPMINEIMERLVAQGSLKCKVQDALGVDPVTGDAIELLDTSKPYVVGEREPIMAGMTPQEIANRRYYPKRVKAGVIIDPALVDAGEVLLPDPEFNYDKLHKPDAGIPKYLVPKVRQIIRQLTPTYGADPAMAPFLDKIEGIVVDIFCGFNYPDVIASSAQERTQTPISPRTKLVASIEATQNLAANALHTFLRYIADKKTQNWLLPLFDFDSNIDAYGPQVCSDEPEHAVDKHLLKEMQEKILNYYGIFWNSIVLRRNADEVDPATGKRKKIRTKLGRLKPPALGCGLGVPNMHETLKIKSSRETISRERIATDYDYDKYLMALGNWSKFIDIILEDIPEDITLEQVEHSSDNGGKIDNIITKVLAVAKLVPGTHYDLVPLMLYNFSQRLLSRFIAHDDRMQLLAFLRRRFRDACKPGQGLDAFAPQMVPLMKLFGEPLTVGGVLIPLTNAEKAELTYGDNRGNKYHKDFEPVRDTTVRKRTLANLIDDWKEKHKDVDPPEVSDYRKPLQLRSEDLVDLFGGLSNAAEKFYADLEDLVPEPPADRRGIIDDAKKA